MKHTQRFKTILASLLVVAALSTPVVVLSTEAPEYNAELYIEGAGLEVMTDGSVQAVFNVSMDRLSNCTGVQFYLFYNEDYLTPSYIADDGTGNTQNKVIFDGNSLVNTDSFFQVDEELYGKRDGNGELINPFQFSGETYKSGTSYYSNLDGGKKCLYMRLALDKTRLGSRVELDEDENETVVNGFGPGGKIKMLHSSETQDDDDGFDVFPVINHEDAAPEKVVLGQLSFRVKKENIAEMLRLFGDFKDGKTTVDDPYNEGTYLLRIADASDDGNIMKEGDDPWAMFTEPSGSGRPDNPYGPKGSDEVHRHVAVRYRFILDGKTVVDVELANPAFTINAYQNYTKADEGDIVLSLGRYSPMATVIYADGTRESFVVPWGQSVVSGIATDYDPGLGGNAYDPTGGHFLPSQKLILERNKVDFRGQPMLDGAGKPIRENYAFPIALVADMTVTPITLVNITAPDLERSYTVNRAVTSVTSGDELALPTQARLLTDVVPSGVSMVIPIPGWSPVQADSSWPVNDGTNTDTLMNSLKADSYNAATGTPYWPDNRDDLTTPEKYRGTYTFRKAESYGGALKPAYEEAEIDALYPWLTTPDEATNPEIYRLDDAVRRIVGDNQYSNAENYVAKYEGTTETEGKLKPTVTFSVRKKNNGTMLDTSVFRVWLPDGTELGTGLTTTGLAAADVEDWFHYATGDLTEQGQPEIGSEGSYETLATEDTTNSTTYFKLITNTGDPTVPALGGAPTDDLREEWAAQQAMREKLRRYINLGGWFTISVSEDPETMAWSEAMPVYVEPRTNVYMGSKEYNFLGENADLLRFPTPVANKITVPHGSYTAVDEKGNLLYNNGGLPDIGSVGANQAALDRWRDEYGLEILYDGQTGAQPGMLYKLTVDNTQKSLLSGKDSWWDTTIPQPQGRADGTTVAGADIFRYGPAPLYHGALYEAMGYVYQDSVPITSEVPAVPNEDSLETVTLRREEGKERERVWEEVILTSEEPTGITTVLDEHNHENVSLATYDTVMEGYQVRQDYTFTLTNVGTTTIYGLGIDGLTDGYPEEEKGGRFEMLQPPADYLAPGQSTTFVLTYVYNLEANKKTDFIAYRDTLYITSDNHPEGGKDKVRREDYLLDFDAEIAVSDSPLHRVELLVYPNEGTNNPSVSPEDPNYKNDPYPMGTADIIVGEQRGTTPSTMSYTSATRSYSEGQIVYVLVEPKDEYQFNITCVDAAEKDIVIPSYEVAHLDIPEVLGDAKLAKGKKVYCFTMPDADTTVTVRFWEDVFSKLRLTDLIDFSAGTEDELKETTERKSVNDVSDKVVASENTFKVWRKSFTVDELNAAAEFSKNMSTSGSTTTSGREDANADMYLMSKGKAIPKDQGGQQFISSENHYIVVIPFGEDFDLSQVQATLRSIVVDHNGREQDPPVDGDALGYLQVNENIPVTVTMARYSSDYMDPDSGYTQSGGFEATGEPYHKTVYQPTNGYAMPTAGATAPYNYLATHVSNTFDSPEPGTSCYVRVRVQGTSTEGGTSATVYRHYYLEIHRAPKDAEAKLNYGNSPFGMIMNDTEIAAAQKQVAKDGFLKEYSFRNVDDDHTPDAVEYNDNSSMRNVTYWREAWVKNRQVYEPESFTGQVQASRVIADDTGGEGGGTGEGENAPKLEYYMVDVPSVYEAKDNLDLSDTAYFAILGEDIYEPGLHSALDSSGRPIDVSKVRVSAEITRLDTNETTQIKRFSGTETAVLDLGWSAQLTSCIAGTGSIPDDGKNYWPMSTTTTTDGEGNTVVTHTEVTDIRPGRYEMVYTYTDFDGESTLSVRRDFVILAPVGDVNVDLTRDSGGYANTDANYRISDEYVLENRVRDPLGYEAQLYTRTKTGDDGLPYTEEVYPYANIFKFRVCDVNNDRNVNNIDGNLINRSVRRSTKTYDAFNRFYDPVNYGLYE